MSNYKKLYDKLFNRITDVIDMLVDIQQKTEEMYIENKEKDEDGTFVNETEKSNKKDCPKDN